MDERYQNGWRSLPFPSSIKLTADRGRAQPDRMRSRIHSALRLKLTADDPDADKPLSPEHDIAAAADHVAG